MIWPRLLIQGLSAFNFQFIDLRLVQFLKRGFLINFIATCPDLFGGIYFPHGSQPGLCQIFTQFWFAGQLYGGFREFFRLVPDQ